MRPYRTKAAKRLESQIDTVMNKTPPRETLGQAGSRINTSYFMLESDRLNSGAKGGP